MTTADYPRFSEPELDRRRAAVLDVMARHELDGVLVFGANRPGSAIQWLSEWPVTRSASLVITRGGRDAMWVQFYNHLPNAPPTGAALRCRLGRPIHPRPMRAVAVAVEAQGRYR